MATGRHFTAEDEYFCRYFRLLNCTVLKTLRQLVLNHVKNNGLTLEKLLKKKLTTLTIMNSRKILQQYQMDLLYPKHGKRPDIYEWDITLLCTIVKYTLNLSPSQKTLIESIRKERNQVSHRNPTMTETEYTGNWQRICNGINVLLKLCNDVNFENEIECEIDSVRTHAIDIQVTLNLYKTAIEKDRMVMDQVSLVSDQLSVITENVQTMKQELFNVTRKVEKCQDSFADDKDIKDKIEKNIEGNLHRPTEGQCVNRNMSIKIKQLEILLERKPRYVQTEQFKRIDDKLMAKGNVVISGKPGEGKTSAAYELMKIHPGKGKRIQIDTPEDIEHIRPNYFEFVFIDDMFGRHELDDSKVNLWLPALEKLQKLSDAKAFKLIIATREIVIKEAKDQVLALDLFRNKVILSSENLNEEEKISILKESLQKKNRHLSQPVIESCIRVCKPDIGFPYMCFLFASSDEFFQEREEFFNHYLVINNDMLSKLKRIKLFSLWYLWVKGGKCKKKDLFVTSAENVSLLTEISTSMDDDKDISSLLNEIKDNLYLMEDVFVIDFEECFMFKHSSIYQSIGLMFAHTGHAERVISSSTFDFFMECFRERDTSRNTVIFLTQNLYPVFVDRIIQEVMKRRHCREIVAHQCISEKLLLELLNRLLKRKCLKKFLLPIQNDMEQTLSFLEGVLATGSQQANQFLQSVIETLKCKFHLTVDFKRRCKVCIMFKHALEGACKGGNVKALELLNFVEVDTSFICIALELTKSKKVFDTIARRVNISSKSRAFKELVIEKAICCGTREMIDHVIQELQVPANTKCLYTAANAKQYALAE